MLGTVIAFSFYMPMNDAQFVGRVQALGPFRDEADATAAIVATLEVLGRGLFEDEARRIAEALPPLPARALRARNRGEALDRTRFFAEIAGSGESRPSQCLEHAEVVCRVLAEAMPPSKLERIHVALPGLTDLLAVKSEPDTPPPQHTRADSPRTLSEGRPGPEHPFASAAPEELAHRHSVPRSEDPHADTKLSSASGLTQEREGRTLSRGKPGSGRPLSRGR